MYQNEISIGMERNIEVEKDERVVKYNTKLRKEK
jgi:hypothetical protein